MTPVRLGASQSAATTSVLIIRHADVHNPGDVLYGRLPRFGLSELGRQQAQHTSQALAAEPLAILYSSPQLRARQTARAIASAHPGLDVKITMLLNEVLTSWQGRSHSDLEQIGFDFYNNPMHPSDETLQNLWTRVQRFVSRTRRRHPGEVVAGVTHGDVAILARAGYMGMPIEVSSLRAPNIYPGKGSITRLVFGADLDGMLPLRVEYSDPNGNVPDMAGLPGGTLQRAKRAGAQFGDE